MATAAAIYCRISQDTEGQGLGVKRQEADCRALAERKGWPVGEVFIDNDVGAWSGKVRPEYRRMLQRIQDHELDAVVVWHLDRLTRRPVELEEFFEICDSAGIKELASVTGDVDLATHDGRFLARILGAVARKESDDKSRRTRRKHLELAEAGKAVGGGRPFGYESDRVTVRAAEAELIREAARRVLAGESLRSIAMDWNTRGITTTRGTGAHQKALRRILMNYRIAGIRSLGETPVGKAEWPAIVDEVTHRRLRAVLLDPSRRVNHLARSYLLSRFLVCGRCGARLITRRQPNRARTYLCAVVPGRPGCGGLRIVAEPLEKLVEELIFEAVDGDDFVEVLGEREVDIAGVDHLAEVAELEGRLEGLARDHYADRVISREQFIAASRELEARLATARRMVAAAETARAVSPWRGRGDDLRATWPDMLLDQRRAVLSGLLESITIGPARHSRGKFDPDRVTAIAWRIS